MPPPSTNIVELPQHHLHAYPVQLQRLSPFSRKSSAYTVCRMEGFIVFDYARSYSSARKELAQWLAEGKIQRKETIVKGGLSKAEQALVDLYNGINTGKP